MDMLKTVKLTGGIKNGEELLETLNEMTQKHISEMKLLFYIIKSMIMILKLESIFDKEYGFRITKISL